MKIGLRNSTLVFIISFLFLSCSYQHNNPDKIRKCKWDNVHIPDKYNTGANENVIFNTMNDTQSINGVNIQLRTDTSEPFYCITGNRNANCPDSVVIKNYDFSNYNFVVQNSHLYKNNKVITFENCKFKGFRNDPAEKNSSRMNCIFSYCSFGGNVSSAYLTLDNCKIGGFSSDAMNPVCDVHCHNLYIYDLCHDANPNEVHYDGIQIYGDQRSRNNVQDGYWVSKLETGNIEYDNVRFEIPSISFENSKAAVNACVMFQLEFSDVNNVTFNRLFVNGGGKWYPLYLGTQKNGERSLYGKWQHKNLVMTDVFVSNNYGTIFYAGSYSADTVERVQHHDYLFVSSAWKDDSGTAHIIVSNDTNSDKVFTVKTDKGTHEFIVPHCPSNWALGGEIDKKVNPDESLVDSTGRSYKSYRWQDMPFDMDYQINGNPSFALCYQGDEQMLYVSFDEREHFYSEIR